MNSLLCIQDIIDDWLCYEKVRELRWLEWVKCPHCQSVAHWLSKTDEHKRINHSKGEFARDDDGDGIKEVHVNTMEYFWSLLRPWLRPHRGISQERLPFYLGFFDFLHNVRKRGNQSLAALIGLLVAT